MRPTAPLSVALWLSLLTWVGSACGDQLPSGPSDDDAADSGSLARDVAADPGATSDPASDDAATDEDSEAAEHDLATDTVEVTIDVADHEPDGSTGSLCGVCSDQRRPVVLVHGIDGSPANFEVMIERLLEDGWSEDDIVAFEAEDPSWGCNVDNAAAIDELVDSLIEASCQPRVDIVAHSMGSLSSRYFMKFLGGHERVNTYVTLGGMHHGLTTPCLAPEFLGVCVWQELCESGEFIGSLNADPVTPGQSHWVSIYGTADDVVPNESSYLQGAENIAIEGAEHDGPDGLLQRADAYAEVLRVLDYPCW